MKKEFLFLNKKINRNEQVIERGNTADRNDKINNRENLCSGDIKIFNNINKQTLPLPHKNLSFEIESWSSYISTFHPRNILIDSKISGQVSKWSVDFKSQNEYLYIKLEKTSIIYIVTFGKFRDPTNLKEFKIYAGLDKSNMIEILHSGLTYEEGYEAFIVKFKWEDVLIPCNYLKIVPLRPWDDNYNISIWFVNIKGIDDEILVNKSIEEFHKKEKLLSMKNWINLSRKNFKHEYLDLLKVQGFEEIIKQVEHPYISSLYKEIMEGEFEKAIEIIDNIFKTKSFTDTGEDVNFLDEYILSQPHKIIWKKLDFIDKEIDECLEKLNLCVKIEEKQNELRNQNSANKNSIPTLNNNQPINFELVENEDEEGLSNLDLESEFSEYEIFSDGIDGLKSPSSQLLLNNEEEIVSNKKFYPTGRGGHSMVIDEENLRIYIFGGWDGSQDLSDFWYYDILNESWHCLDSDENESPFNHAHPSKRSCHKMVYDNKYSRILLYGKYSKPNEVPIDNFLYEYNIVKGRWSKLLVHREKRDGKIISENCGPGLVYDHQLVIDSEKQVLYLFGGNRIPEIEDPLNGNGKYLGLWKLDLKELIWENLLNEQTSDPYDIKLKSRSGHSMLISRDKEIIIFGGNKGPRKGSYSNYLFDMIIYDPNTNTVREHFHDYSKKSGPFVNFSFASFYNRDLNEIYFFGGGLVSEKNDVLTNNFWIYNLSSLKWSKCELDFNNLINYDKILLSNNFYSNYIEVCSNYSNSQNELKNNFYSNTEKNINSNSNFNYDSLNEPIARYAHTLVFSHRLNKGFIFGGNPNIKNSSKNTERLNDFWSFELNRQTKEMIKNRIYLKIYKTFYEEMCNLDKLDKALNILRNKIVPLLETNKNKEKKINKFTSFLIKNNTNNLSLISENTEEKQIVYKRFYLFEYIAQYLIKSRDFDVLNR